MDILDQIAGGNKIQFLKTSKDNKMNKIQNSPEIFIPEKIKNAYRSNSFQKINQVESQQNTFSINELNNNKQNRGGITTIPSSFGVIASQGNSEDRKISNMEIEICTDGFKRRNTLQQIGNNINLTSNVSSAQCQEIKDKYKQIQLQKRQLQQQVKNQQKKMKEKQKQILMLQHKLEKQLTKNSEDRIQIINEQSQFYQKQIQKLKKTQKEELSNKQQALEWSHKNRQKILRQQVQSLKLINEKYKALLNTQNQIFQQKYKTDLKYQEECSQTKRYCQKIEEKEKEINEKQKKMEQGISEFQKQRKQFYRQKERIIQQLDEQEVALKRKKLQMNQQLQSKSQKLNQNINQSIKQIEEKKAQMQLQMHEIQAMKDQVEKEKEENIRLNQKLTTDYKTKVDSLMVDKQKVFQMETQLINKINIVELYAQKYINFCPKSNQSANETKNYQSVHQSTKVAVNTSITQTEPKNGVGHQENRSSEKKKKNVADYLSKVQETCKLSKIGNRRIYKLQEFYM